ncbi:MAG: GtrA family protein [Burkholderiales bacterium]
MSRNDWASNELNIFIRYVLSGGAAAAAHFLILILLVEGPRLNATFASALGFCFACAVNYTLQYHWTFSSTGMHRVIGLRYVAVTLLMLMLNTALFWALHQKLSVAYLLAQVIATAAVVICNFTVNRLYTFTAGVAKNLS